MLLNQAYNPCPTYSNEQLPYNTVESILQNVSANKRMLNSTRHIRGQSLSHMMGSTSRIVKPSSTNNSPRSHASINRRKTMMSRPYASNVLSTGQSIHNQQYSNTTFPLLRTTSSSTRPMSWHPSSYFIPPQPYRVEPSYTDFSSACNQTVYSDCISPLSTFSPFSLPLSENDYQHSPGTTSAFFPSLDSPNTLYTSTYVPLNLPQATMTYPQPYQAEWNDFTNNGFCAMTNPPTPEMLNHETSFELEQNMLCRPTEEAEQGEELVALGLYDSPVKDEIIDASLNTYHSSMLQYYSHALCQVPMVKNELNGKGLKLEEAWAPPPDEDDATVEGETIESSPELLPADVNALARFNASHSVLDAPVWCR